MSSVRVLLMRLSAAVFIVCGACHSVPVLAEDPISDLDRDHWSYRPILRAEIPDAKQTCDEPIDAFIRTLLDSEGLRPAPQADKRTLIRRLSFALTGLPPHPDDVQEFLTNDAPDAFAQWVDRLLASSQYGAHQAQSWLDLARFAETDGFEHDKVRPNAWRYRDWVIDSLNDNQPLDEFIRWQLAGDLVAPDDPAARIATGFLLNGPDMPDINLKNERRHNVLNEMTSTVGSALLGLQIGCAQCHDHKFDAISQHDFYRFRAWFENAVDFRDHPLSNGSQSLGRVVRENSKRRPARFFIRGDFRREGEIVPVAFPRIAATNQPAANTADRRNLAEWVTSPNNPLFPRVMANRIWQDLFGRGLSDSPADFGVMGDEPTHLELLDWLASELPRQHWDRKHIQRQILNSATWQQSSRPGSSQRNSSAWRTAQREDPDNLLLSHRSRQRLSGEQIRDTMLHVAGRLSQRRGGPGIRPPLPREVVKTLLHNQWPVTKDVRDHNRRSVYLFVRRNLRFPLFDVFDKPDTNQSCAVRHQSTTAPQSLTLLNSELTHQLAAHLATEIGSDFESLSTDDAVRQLYRRTLSRHPDADELSAAREFLGTNPSPQNLQQLAVVLFNVNEFIYID